MDLREIGGSSGSPEEGVRNLQGMGESRSERLVMAAENDEWNRGTAVKERHVRT